MAEAPTCLVPGLAQSTVCSSLNFAFFHCTVLYTFMDRLTSARHHVWGQGWKRWIRHSPVYELIGGRACLLLSSQFSSFALLVVLGPRYNSCPLLAGIMMAFVRRGCWRETARRYQQESLDSCLPAFFMHCGNQGCLSGRPGRAHAILPSFLWHCGLS